jgi:hypothetical protein
VPALANVYENVSSVSLLPASLPWLLANARRRDTTVQSPHQTGTRPCHALQESTTVTRTPPSFRRIGGKSRTIGTIPFAIGHSENGDHEPRCRCKERCFALRSSRLLRHRSRIDDSSGDGRSTPAGEIQIVPGSALVRQSLIANSRPAPDCRCAASLMNPPRSYPE